MIDRPRLHQFVIISIIVIIINSFIGRDRSPCLVVNRIIKFIVRVNISLSPWPNHIVLVVYELQIALGVKVILIATLDINVGHLDDLGIQSRR